jgi:hypothetical protein
MAQSNGRRARMVALVVVGVAVATAKRARWTPVRVEGDSMDPTLPAGSLVAMSPLRGDPSFGCVVVIRRSGGTEHIKRIVATPGERFRVGVDEITLGEEQYAVAGDDRARSTDSRHHGPVAREEIVGVARACYWPPRSWRLFAR